MNYTGKHLQRLALKLGYVLVEGKKHIRVYNSAGRYISTLSRGIVQPRILKAILKQLGITKEQLAKMS